MQGAGTKGGQAAGQAATTALTAATTKGATQAGTQAGKALGQSMTAQVKATAVGLGSVIGTLGAGLFLKSAFDEQRESLRVAAQLGAVLKSTGGEAGVTRQHIDSLVASQKELTAVDDEVISRGAALLLTFRHIRNEVGAGNAVFDRSLKAAQDLSAAFNDDLQGSIILVGKALEDPILGLTALQRRGVQFTEQQKEQVKALVASGNALQAQKIILKEIETQVGGTAAAIAKADPFQRFGVQFGDFKEQVGKDLLPAASQTIQVGEKLIDIFGVIPAPVRATGEVLAAVGLGLAGVSRVASVLAGGPLGALRSQFFRVAEGEGAASTGAFSLSKALGAVGLTVAAVALISTVIDDLGKEAPDLDRLAKAAENFAKSGVFDAALAQAVGQNADKIGEFLHLVDSTTAFGDAGSGLNRVSEFFTDPFSGEGATEINTAQNALKGIDQTLRDLVSGGNAETAAKLFDFLNQKAIEQGRSIDSLTNNLPLYNQALADQAANQAAAASSAQSLTDKLKGLADGFFTARQAQLGLDDQFASADQALKDLNETRLDAFGQGEKSKAAAEEEAAALEGVKEAHRGVTDAVNAAADASRALGDAQRSLLEAQRDLAEFDNPTSQTIRALERTQIVQRQVITPEDVRQKTIDLLKFDQETANKRGDLQGRVADANRQVADAVRGVADAQDRVREATLKVGEAERAVSAAAQKRRDIQVAAAGEIRVAERKAEEAILAAGLALKQFAEDAEPGDDVLGLYLDKLNQISLALDPGGELSRRLTLFAQGLNPQGQGALTDLLTQALRGKSGPIDLATLLRIASGDTSGVTPAQRKILHDLGIPGFAFGGIVPGLLGEPRLIVAHGGENVQTPAQQRGVQPVSITQNNENHFHGSPLPTAAELDYAARDAAWRLRRLGRIA